jgi:hypothetical protein
MAAPEPARAGPIVQFWDGEEVPAEVAGLMATFDELNPGRPHRVFSARSAAELIGERFGERQLAAFRSCAVPAMQADYFRYCAIHALGGVYVDVDFRCVVPLDPLLRGPQAGTLFGRRELPPRWRVPEFEWRERVGPFRVVMNSFFAFSAPGHPLLELAIEIATVNVERRVSEDVALVTGPAIFTSLYLLHRLGSFDAFLAYAEGGTLAGSAGHVCEAVGDQERAALAFEDVDMPEEEESRLFVRSPESPLPYKGTEDHWLNVTTSIYR